MKAVTEIRAHQSGTKIPRAAYDSLPDGILVFNADEQLIYWNARVREFDPSFAATLDVGHQAGTVIRTLERFAAGDLARDWHPADDGTTLLILRRPDPESRRLLMELARAREVAEQANLAKTRFLAAASHDLRQPLQALAMFVAVLADRDHDPADTALIGRIQDSVTAVEELLNSILDISKLEAGLVTPVFSNFAVADLFERLGAEFGGVVADTGLRFKIVATQAQVCSDPSLLERVLRNLLSNAVRYTASGGILLGCRRRGDCLRIEVVDTGIGIPASQREWIFREFHQLGNHGRDRRKGLGLGLAVVDRLARLLGHKVNVTSELGRGSIFSIDVPIAQLGQGARKPNPQQSVPSMNPRDALVAVIDDEPDVLESTRLALESWQYTVVTANDCDQMLSRLAQMRRAPDLILADYRLQNGATGGQAIGRIRSRFKIPGLPAIIMTGDTAPERLRQAKAGGHSLLHKPVQPTILKQTIESLLAGAQARQYGAS